MNSRVRALRLSCAFAAAALCAGPITAGPIEALYTTIPGHPTSVVPGMDGMTFNSGVTTQFDRPYASPSGQRWIMRARLAPPATNENNEVILVGWDRLAAVALREGASDGLGPGEVYGAFGRVMGINDAGQFVFSSRALSGSSGRDVIMKWDGGRFGTVAREQMPAPAAQGGLYGAPLDSPNILNDGVGTVCFRAGNIQFGQRAGQAIWYRGEQILAATRDPEFAPYGQLDDPSVNWGSLEPGRLRVDASGEHWIGMGVLQAPVLAQAVVVNNGVVAQQGAVLLWDPMGRTVAPVASAAVDESMSHNGRCWMTRGAFTNTDDYVVRNGVLVASTGGRITVRPGETERYGDLSYPQTFFLNVCNGAGDYLIGGVTNAPDDDANAVVVLNRRRVVVREGDPIDLDGDGDATNDDAYVGVFNNDDAFYTDDGWFYFTADLRNGAGALTGQGLLRVRVCAADWDGSGRVASNDIAAYLTDWIAEIGRPSGLADYNEDGSVDSEDISAFLTAWLAALAAGC